MQPAQIPLVRDCSMGELDQSSPWCPGLWLTLGPFSPVLGGRGTQCSLFGLFALLVLIQLHHMLV